MRERGVCFTPTLSASAGDIIPMSDSPAAVALAIRSRAMLPRAQESVRHALQIGVKVIAGADTGYSPDDPHRLSDEMAELSRTGMPLIEVVRAATSRAAECIGISRRAGAIRVGLEADLIVLDRNPLEDIDAVRDVLLVVNDGKIAVNHLQF